MIKCSHIFTNRHDAYVFQTGRVVLYVLKTYETFKQMTTEDDNKLRENAT